MIWASWFCFYPQKCRFLVMRCSCFQSCIVFQIGVFVLANILDMRLAYLFLSRKINVLNGYVKLYSFPCSNLQTLTVASSNYGCGETPIANVVFSAFEMLLFPMAITRHVNIAYSFCCYGVGPVACLYFDAFEMLLLADDHH